MSNFSSSKIYIPSKTITASRIFRSAQIIAAFNYLRQFTRLWAYQAQSSLPALSTKNPEHQDSGKTGSYQEGSGTGIAFKIDSKTR